MGILVALPEIITEIAEVAAEAAAAAAEAAAEAAAVAAEAASEAAIDSAIDAGVEGAVSGLVDGGIDSALDSALDAAIDGISGQIARTAGGQAIKKLVDKVGEGAAKRVIDFIKDKVKDQLKDEAKQDLKDFISGKLQPPPPPTDVGVPTVPDGLDINKLTIDVNGGQYLMAENYFKAVHGVFLQARQNENVAQMIQFAVSAAQTLAGMANARQANPVVFRVLNFDGDLGTSKWVDALAVYNGIITKLQAEPNTSNDEANAIVDPVKDDLQNKINDALTNTYVAPDIPLPDLTQYRGVTGYQLRPLKSPTAYPIIEDAMKALNTTFRAAFNVSNKNRMCQAANLMAVVTQDAVDLRKASQPALDITEVDAAGATADWNTINTFWTQISNTITFPMTHDDINKLLLSANPSLDSINDTQRKMYAKTAKATQQQIIQRQAQQQQPKQTPQPGAPRQPGAPQQPSAAQQPGAPRRPGAPQNFLAQKQPPGSQARPKAQQQTLPQQTQPKTAFQQQPAAFQNQATHFEQQQQQQRQQALARQQKPPGGPRPRGTPPATPPSTAPSSAAANGGPPYDPVHSVAHQAISYGANAAAPHIANAAAPHVANAVKTAGPGLARQGVGYALGGLYGGSAPTPVSAIPDAPTPVSAFPDAPGVNGVNGAPVAPGAGKGRGKPASRGARGRGRGK